MNDRKKGDKYILAIDHGTSGAKTALMSVYGELVDFEFEKTSIHYLPDGGVEQDPAEWWSAIINTSRRLIAKGLVPVDDIIAICCSSTFSSTVAVDSRGRHLMNSMTWMDSRGAEAVKRRMKGLINIRGYSLSNIYKWTRKSGGAPGTSGKEDVAHVLYVKDELPDVYNKTHAFLGSKDFLNLKFTGKFAASFDSMTLFWITDTRDVNNVKYDASLIKSLGIDGSKFPPMMASTDVLATVTPEVARSIGIRDDVKVIVGSPDLQSACVGSGATRDYEGHVYVGTSSWILCHVPFKKTDAFHVIASLPSSIPGKYFCANEQDTAGGCVEFLMNNLLFHKNELQSLDPPEDAYEKLSKVVERTAPGSEGVIFTPWLNGEKTPVEDMTARGGFHNISTTTNADQMIRAVFEGVAFNSRWVLRYVEKFVGRKMDPLNIIGGGAQSAPWCQIYADVLGRTIRQVADPLQSNARGAALIASVALGFITFDDVPDLVNISKVFKPNPANKAIYDKLFKEFLNIYKKNKSIYRRLNARL